jgi:hypothetical protein
MLSFPTKEDHGMGAASSQRADRNRVLAMRLVGNIVNAQFSRDWEVEGQYMVKSLFVPTPSDWAFIDMDPMLGPDEWFALYDNKYNAQWPIDLALAFPWHDEYGNPGGPGDFRIGHARTITPKEVRNIATVFSPKMAILGNLDFVDGKYDFGGGCFSLVGGRWRNAVDLRPRKFNRTTFSHSDTPYADEPIGLMIGAALRHRYEWSVILNFPNCRARFSTDATGALKMFKDRNLPQGEGRRSPLLHWVAKHWRQRRNVPSDLIEVRKHLRGRSDFDWRGFPVTVIPAEFEIEQALRAAS